MIPLMIVLLSLVSTDRVRRGNEKHGGRHELPAENINWQCSSAYRMSCAGATIERRRAGRRGGGTFIRWRADTWSGKNIISRTLMADDSGLQFRCSGSPPPLKEASTAWHQQCATPSEEIQLCFGGASEDPDLALHKPDVRCIWRLPKPHARIALLHA